jgi:N-acetylmuramoyl-L-alanine amidase
MRLRHALAGAIALSLLASALVATSAGDAEIAAPAAASSGEPKLSIARPSERRYVARFRFEAPTAARIEIAMRLVGKPLGDEREAIATEVVEETAGPGPVRVSAPFRGALRSCFAYVRCRLAATGTYTEDPGGPPGGGPPQPGVSATDARRVPTGRPRIRERHIPYGPKRREQMAAYSKRHYGAREWRLDPRGIVEHYTATRTAGPALNYFASNRPDVEYGELPGVCAHFLIDRDGTILELVPTDVRCRHTVGLNHETIGIEHVGRSDGDVVGRPRVLRRSLALTGWLRCALAIRRRNVIGHNESLGSPLYEEHVARFQGRTHADMKPATMRRYRRKLKAC